MVDPSAAGDPGHLLPAQDVQDGPRNGAGGERKAGRSDPGARRSAKLISDATVLINDASQGVASIKDEASATAALPKLKDITAKLGGLHSQWAKLPQPIQKTVSDALRPLIAKLREVANLCSLCP